LEKSIPTRRDFLKFTTAAGLSWWTACGPGQQDNLLEPEPLFRISLAQWSLHRSTFGSDPGETWGWEEFNRLLRTSDYSSVLAGPVDPLDFPGIARQEFGIEAVEWVNLFFFDRAEDRDYLNQMKSRAEGEGVRSLLIMCDAEGQLGDPDESLRKMAVDNHRKWLEAAQFLGCHSIRVNAASDAALPRDEQQKLAADGLRSLCEVADAHGINILVENHGGLSSDAQWLAGVMEKVEHSRIGTLPDFGNFEIDEATSYDRYQGVQELMPYARSVSAKSYDFDEQGNETSTDFRRMMKIVLDAGFKGFVGIEYEGGRLSEMEGIRATQRLLQRVRDELSSG
jgi:sugar phosphate isomerase/epimerase